MAVRTFTGNPRKSSRNRKTSDVESTSNIICWRGKTRLNVVIYLFFNWVSEFLFSLKNFFDIRGRVFHGPFGFRYVVSSWNVTPRRHRWRPSVWKSPVRTNTRVRIEYARSMSYEDGNVWISHDISSFAWRLDRCAGPG